MKIGAKEMKKAYKDVKLDQIDVWLFFFPAFPDLLFYNKCILIHCVHCVLIKITGFTGPAGGHDG